jgi:outer membrane autotransporter protein
MPSYSTAARPLNGLKGDFENNKNAFSLTDRGSSSIQIGDEDTAQTTVNGEIVTGVDTVLYVGGKNVLLDNAGHTALYANANSKSVEIGRTTPEGNTSDSVAIKGRLLVNGVSRMDVVGKNITLSNGAAPDSGTLGTTVKTKEDGTSTDPDSNTHDALVIQSAADNALVVGEADSNVNIDGRLVGLNGGYSVDGDIIHIYEGTNKNQNLVLTTGGAVNLGHDGTSLLQIDGGIWALGDSTNAVNLQGRNILVDPASGMRAVQANAMPVTIGDNATEHAVANGEIWSVSNKAPITLDANSYALSANGSTYAARSSGGGSITIGHDGSTGSIDGNLTADVGSSLEAYLQGNGSRLDGTIEDENFDYDISSDAGVTLHLNDGAVWHLDGDSKVTSLQADKGIIHLNQDTTDQSLYTGNFAGDGATVYMGHEGNTTQNDRLYVKGTHTGTTQLQLHAVNGTWTDGAIGSVLASVGDEQGRFYVPDTEDRLFFHRTLLDTHETSRGDDVTDGYNTDWYIKGFRKMPTDDHGNYTHTVQGIMGADGINYHIWRTEQDTLFRRMGDLRKGEPGQEGIWARVKGTSIRCNGQFPFEDRYKTYEVGYDQLAGHSDTQDHYQGIGFGYTEGKASYFGGRSDTNSYALGCYDTRIRKDGTYLDLALRLHRLTNKLIAHDGISGHGDNTGLSLGAEYGYKKQLGHGWFVEPQIQGTLGWLSGASWTMENGVTVDEQDIRSAVGRAGLRAGYEGSRAQVFLKANWYHEFGGSGQVHLSDDEGDLFLDRDYGDTWFEYGLGASAQIGPATQFYADVERSSGGQFRKDWSWDAGIRWNF